MRPSPKDPDLINLGLLLTMYCVGDALSYRLRNTAPSDARRALEEMMKKRETLSEVTDQTHLLWVLFTRTYYHFASLSYVRSQSVTCGT